VLNDYDASRYEGKAEFLIATLHLCGNTAPTSTHLAPFRDGADLAGLPLDPSRTFGGRLDATTRVAQLARWLLWTTFTASAHRSYEFSRHWVLSVTSPTTLSDRRVLRAAGAAAWLSSGSDSLNIDDIADMARPAHTTLLRAACRSAST